MDIMTFAEFQKENGQGNANKYTSNKKQNKSTYDNSKDREPFKWGDGGEPTCNLVWDSGTGDFIDGNIINNDLDLEHGFEDNDELGYE